MVMLLVLLMWPLLLLLRMSLNLAMQLLDITSVLVFTGTLLLLLLPLLRGYRSASQVLQQFPGPGRHVRQKRHSRREIRGGLRIRRDRRPIRVVVVLLVPLGTAWLPLLLGLSRMAARGLRSRRGELGAVLVHTFLYTIMPVPLLTTFPAYRSPPRPYSRRHRSRRGQHRLRGRAPSSSGRWWTPPDAFVAVHDVVVFPFLQRRGERRKRATGRCRRTVGAKSFGGMCGKWELRTFACPITTQLQLFPY